MYEILILTARLIKQWINILLDYLNENPRYFDLTYNNIYNYFNYPKVAQTYAGPHILCEPWIHLPPSWNFLNSNEATSLTD